MTAIMAAPAASQVPLPWVSNRARGGKFPDGFAFEGIPASWGGDL